MVYYIDHTIHDALSARDLTEDEEVFFANLANQYHLGHCYLCGDVQSLAALSAKLGTPSHKIYRQVAACYAESGAVMNLVRIVVVLSFSGSIAQVKLPSVLQADGKVCFVPVAQAEHWSQNHHCCLLGENLNDCKLYEYIAAYYCQHQRIKGLQVAFHHENGGGNTINRVLSKCVREDQVLTLCIVDSDQKYGWTKAYGSPCKGETCRLVKEESDKLNQEVGFPPHHLHILPVREVENLIPTQILRAFPKRRYPELSTGIKQLETLATILEGKPVLYYDFKLGFPIISHEPQRVYWKQVLLALGRTEEEMPPCAKPMEDVDPTALRTFPPITNKDLLAEAIDQCQQTDVATLVLDAYLERQWEDLGSLLLTWGCVTPQWSA